MNPTDDDRYVGDWAVWAVGTRSSRKWRVAAAAVALAVPGILLGAVARLFVPDSGPVPLWAAGGAAVGAALGGLLESSGVAS